MHFRIFLCFFVLLASSCTTVSKEPLPEGPVLPTAQVAPIISKLIAHNQAITSFRGLSHSRITHGQEQSSLRHAITFVKPDRLRIEAWPLNAIFTLNLMVARGGELTFLDPARKEALITEANEKSIRATLRVAASVEDLMDLLTGGIPGRFLELFSPDRTGRIYADIKSGNYILLGDENYGFYGVLSPNKLLPQEIQLRDVFTNNVVLNISYADWQEIIPENSATGIPCPGRVTLVAPQDKLRFELVLSGVTLNKLPKDDHFAVKIPEDFKIEHQ